MFFSPIARRKVAAGFLLIVLAWPAWAKPSPTPRHFEVSLGFSTLDETPLDSAFWRASLRDTNWLKNLAASGREASVVVPIFEDGAAFFPTQTAPFANRNPQEREDEILLRRFLKEARARKVKVWLGVDALGWQKPAPQGWQNLNSRAAPIFESAPELEELGPTLQAPEIGPRFASPWNGRVQSALESLLREIGARFPEANGVTLDVHLSRTDPSGFGAAARVASRREIGLDPVALGIQGTADEVFSPDAARWANWRAQSLQKFTENLVAAYRSARNDKNAPIRLAGVADYGRVAGFDALRSGQNWRVWRQVSGIAGVWLEGRWSEGDAKVSNVSMDEKSAEIPVAVPQLSRRALGLEWSLWSANPNSPFGVVANDGAALKTALDFLQGRAAPVAIAPLVVGATAPEWELANDDGTLWKSRALRGQKAILLLVQGSGKKAGREWKLACQNLEKAAPALKLRGVAPVAIGEKNAAFGDSEILGLRDGEGILRAQTGKNNALWFVDRAGFLRANQNVKANQIEAKAREWGDSTPRLELGKMAPDFSVADMNGQARTLTDLRGKKALLLSFFPKCFTGGCANHVASLSSQWEEFEKRGVEVLGVSVDSADVQREFAARWNLRFSLVPDTGRQLCFLYEAVSDVESLAARQSVLIDKNGVVIWIDRNVQVASHGLDVVEILKKRLQ